MGMGDIKRSLLRECSLLFMVLCAALHGCAYYEKEDLPIRVGVTPFIGYSFLYLAEEKGYLSEGGLNIELVDLSSLGDVRRAYERGQVDVVTGTLMEQLVAMSNTRKPALAFYVIDYSMGADRLVALGPYRSMADLKGKKIAYEPQTVDMVMLHLALESAQMSFKDIVPVPMSQTEMPKALLDGQIDAAEVYPPSSIEILKHSEAVTLFDSSRAPYTVVDILFGEADFVQKNSTRLAALVRAFRKAKAYYTDHPDEAKVIMARRMRISAQEVGAAFEGLEMASDSTQKELLKSGGALDEKLKTFKRIFSSQDLLNQMDDDQSAMTLKVIEDPKSEFHG